ncbi:MAG: hypothetical protein WBA74_11150 [Cyclobacteriaceae bacterium]
MESRLPIQTFRKKFKENRMHLVFQSKISVNLIRWIFLLLLLNFGSGIEANAQQRSPVQQLLKPVGKEGLQSRGKELSSEDIELHKIYDHAYLRKLKLSNPDKYAYITGFFTRYEKLKPEIKAIADKKVLYELYFRSLSQYEGKIEEYTKKSAVTSNE